MRGKAPPPEAAGRTIPEAARYLRVGEDKIRRLIARGELIAVNMADVRCGKARWIVLPDALAAFVKARQATPPPAPAKCRKRIAMVDYYPD